MLIARLCEVVIQQIEPSPLDEIGAGEFHHLPDSLLIPSAVALGFALFAHRLGVMGASEAFPDAISQEF